jgi:UDP-N-acetylglucosamine 2-epimerase
MKPYSVVVVLGTRPEAIKLAPVISLLKRIPKEIAVTVLSTGQHREMLGQILGYFRISPDIDLALMQADQTPGQVASRILQELDPIFSRSRPDLVLVQGDTTTAFAAALSAFYHRTAVAHVEAGLRSRDLDNPFPEEANRKFIGVVAGIHFAPTLKARQNLLDEGVAPERVIVTGNTVVDGLLRLSTATRRIDAAADYGIDLQGKRLVLVTSHRRESWGKSLEEICLAIRDIVHEHGEVVVAFPVHLNPRVQEPVRRHLGGLPRVHLLPPLDYAAFVGLMRRADLILTDSGGVQEEGPTFGVPVVVMREVTERGEGLDSGHAVLAGTERRAIVKVAGELLTDELLSRRLRKSGNPYGDGRASERIVTALQRYFRGEAPLLPEGQSFAPQVLSAGGGL